MKKLTKKSKWMLYLSIFISGIVIFSTIFYFIFAKDNVNDNKEKVVLIIIITIAVLAVLSMVFTRIKLRKNTKNLSREFFEAYEDIADKLNGLSMSSLEKKETLSDILDLFLQADRDNRNVNDVIGENTNEFVKQIHESFGYRSKFIYNLLTGVQYSIIYVLMMQGAAYLRNSSQSFFNQEVSLSLFLLLISVAFICVPFMVNCIRNGKILIAATIPIAVMVVFIATMETLHAFFLHIPFLYTIVEGGVNIMPNLTVLILWILTFVLASLLKIVQRKLSVKRL